MKRLKSMLVTLAMLLCTISASAHDFEVDGIYYNITDSEKLTVSVVRKDNSFGSYSGSVEIPENVIYNSKTYSVTSIGDETFRNCTRLTSITIPNSVTSIGISAFYYCYNLTSITIPNSVTSIGGSAFYRCISLTSVTIPNSVTSIGEIAFYDCRSLTSITIGNGVTHIESDAFNDCSSLTSIVVDSENKVYDSRENCNAIIETKSNILITGCVNTVLVNSVTGIGDYAFRGCSGLSTINIPASITSIGKDAYNYCSNLTSVYLNATSHVKIYSSSTFGSSPVFVPSDLFDTYKTMEYWSEIYKNGKLLSNTDKLDYDVNVTAKPTTSDLLSEIKEADLHKVINLKINGSINSYDIIVLNQNMPNLRYLDLTNAKIVACDHEYDSGHKTSNDTIGDYMFYNQIKYIEIKLPKTVKSIGKFAFSYCTHLTSIIIPNSVSSIGFRAFEYCSNLTSITIGKSVTSIGSSAFFGCRSLTSINIPDGVTSIGSDAFSGCDSLSSVHVSDIAAWCNIKFSGSSSNPLYYAKHLYINGKEIKELVIPDGVTSISNSAFSGCTSLTSITIPNSVTSIGNSAFSGCTSLTSITIPNSVTSIGNGAFEACTSTKEITCKAETPPTINTSVFEGIDKTIPLYVPKGSVLKYKAAANWKDFVIIREIAETETDVYLTITDCANGNVKLKVDEDKPYFTLKIEAETGWHIHSVTFNDGDVTAELSADGEYTTPAIGTDSRLNIIYAQGSSSVNSVSDSKIKVWASGNNIIVDNAILNETINVYTLDGMKITSVNANSNRVEIPLTTGVVYIVKVADKVLKVAL